MREGGIEKYLHGQFSLTEEEKKKLKEKEKEKEGQNSLEKAEEKMEEANKKIQALERERVKKEIEEGLRKEGL
ncbi:MAG: hypothetical protein HYV52_03875 [Parcubacteria group bacterium]|nr:hypothetical protein [Parcubacteria group bacterium]